MSTTVAAAQPGAGGRGADEYIGDVSEPTGQSTQLFHLTQEGSDAETAFTVARERDKWNDREDIALKSAFILANRPKGVSAEHFVRWISEVIDNPEHPDVPKHHLETVKEAVDKLLMFDQVLAIECSWSEATTHLWEKGHVIRRGKPRPHVYRFIGKLEE